MKYYRYEKEKDMTLKDWLLNYLNNKGIHTDCIVCFGLGVFDNSESGESVKKLGNVYVHYDMTLPSGDCVYSCEDFAYFEDILYIYGYTLIDEVIMKNGVT